MTGLTQRRPFGSSARRSPSCWIVTTLCRSVTDQCSPARMRCGLSVLLLLDSYTISGFEPFFSVSSCEQTFLFHLGRTQRWNFWQVCVLNFVGKHQFSSFPPWLCSCALPPVIGVVWLLLASAYAWRCPNLPCSVGRQQGLVWFAQHFSADEDVSISSHACWLFEFFFLKDRQQHLVKKQLTMYESTSGPLFSSSDPLVWAYGRGTLSFDLFSSMVSYEIILRESSALLSFFKIVLTPL